MPMKTYEMVCPNPDCNEHIEAEFDPVLLNHADEAGEDLGIVECDTCNEEHEIEYDATADTITLIRTEEPEDEEEDEDDDDEDDEEEDEEEDEDTIG